MILELPMVNLIPDPALAALKARFGEALETLSLSERHVLATAHMEGAVSNLRLQEILEDHKADITRLLQGLCERSFLTRSGRGRWTTYVISEPENPQGDLLDTPPSTGDSYHKGPDSYHKGGENEAPGQASQDWELLEKIAEPVSHAKRVPYLTWAGQDDPGDPGGLPPSRQGWCLTLRSPSLPTIREADKPRCPI